MTAVPEQTHVGLAEKGQGAFLNGQRLRVSDADTLLDGAEAIPVQQALLTAVRRPKQGTRNRRAETR